MLDIPEVTESQDEVLGFDEQPTKYKDMVRNVMQQMQSKTV